MKFITGDVQDVVLATDFTEHSRMAFDAAVRAARLFGARLHILHINEEEFFFATHDSTELTGFIESVVRRRTEWLARMEQEANDLGVEAVAVSRHGVASEGIVEYANEVDAGLIVLGMVGSRGLRRMLTGSTATRVLRGAHRPVLLLSAHSRVNPASDGGSYEDILYPTDLSPASHAGLEIGEDLVRRSGGRLLLLHVLKLPTIIPSIPGEPPIMIPGGTTEGLESKLRGELEGVARDVPGVEVETILEVHGDPAEGIAEVAERERVDLIVVPRHSKGKVSDIFFGRTAEHLARISPVPVLVFTPETSDGE
ncbi:MAG: universal stress protein [Myxococcota bacterium]